MKLIQWTLFIDMLGYRDINGGIKSDENADAFIEFMKTNELFMDGPNSQAVKDRYAKDDFDLYKYYDVQHAFVSDSLIYTFKPREIDEEIDEAIYYRHSANAYLIIIMRLVTYIFNCFHSKNIFLRGGVSNKYCTIKGAFAVGEGLVEAYLCESKNAIYPRIVLHSSILENGKLMRELIFLSWVMYGRHDLIKKDIDNQYYLNYLGYIISMSNPSLPMNAAHSPAAILGNLKTAIDYIKGHAASIEKNLAIHRRCVEETAGNEIACNQAKKVLKKYEWLKDYHNSQIDKTPYQQFKIA